MIAGAIFQKYFTTCNDLSELGNKKTFHSQVRWWKSQFSMPKNKNRILFISICKACCILVQEQ